MPQVRKIDGDNITKAAAFYAGGASMAEIAWHFQCSLTAVSNALERAGVKRRKRLHQMRLTTHKRMGRLKDRIRAHVAPDQNTGCWNFIGPLQPNGYAKITYRRKTYWFHRLAYQAYYGVIPEGKEVRHRCDNRKCGNPMHLLTGTRTENMQDAVARGRIARGERLAAKRRGEKSNFAKLNWEQVGEIRDRNAAGESNEALAAEYRVSVDNIRRITRFCTWKTGIGVGIGNISDLSRST